VGHPESVKTPIVLDFFQGELTEAWEQIRPLPNIQISLGDDCNCYVATADVIAKLVDYRLFARRKKLYVTDIKECFPDFDIAVEFLDELRFIVPKTNQPIDISPKVIHPVIFILKEGRLLRLLR
jgi:hypothetical protein